MSLEPRLRNEGAEMEPNEPPGPAPALVIPPAGQVPWPRLGADH
jgi:hypothetical protein